MRDHAVVNLVSRMLGATLSPTVITGNRKISEKLTPPCLGLQMRDHAVVNLISRLLQMTPL